MKKNFSFLNKRNRHYLAVWAAFHLLILVFFGIRFALNKNSMKIDADLFNMLPQTYDRKEIGKADNELTVRTAQTVTILVRNKSFSEARRVAVEVYSKLRSSKNFSSLDLFVDQGKILSETSQFIRKYKYNLLSDEDIDLIESGKLSDSVTDEIDYTGLPEFSKAVDERVNLDDVNQQIVSVFTSSDDDETVLSDPFFLEGNSVLNYLETIQENSGSMKTKEGVIAGEFEGNWYVMISGTLSKKGAALASSKNGVSEIYSVCSPYEKDGTYFVYSGTPFHSHKSSTSAVKEISWISTVSIAVVIIMLLLVFRTPSPIIWSLCSIGCSIFAAFSATMGIFGKIHILTLVFGTSLIGSCIDYSLHFFINWKGNDDLKTGSQIRKYLFSGLTLSLISTEVCFLVLAFAPFNLLRQISCFSSVGILSSYLTVMCIYPCIKIPEESNRKVRYSSIVITRNWYNKKKVGRAAISIFFIFTITAGVIGFKRFWVQNDILKLYTKEGRVLNDEIEKLKVLKYSPTGWYIVGAKTEDELLQCTEALSSRLVELKKTLDFGTFVSVSNYLPSFEKQKKSIEASRKLLPYVQKQYEQVWGMEKDEAAAFASKIKIPEEFITFNDLPSFIKNNISTAWLGKVGRKYYTVVLPGRMTVKDDAAFRALAEQDSEHVFFVNKSKDMSHDFDSLTITILKMFLIAYILIFIVLRIFYKWKQAFKIISIPLLIILMVSAFFAIMNIHLEFFSITGIILVFGLGIDYVIYMIEAERRAEKSAHAKLEPFAILLSFITTAVSFGALTFSSFVPVHLMGLAIFIGLATAYASSFFYDRSDI
jgi:predicted exporter